jgi:phosphate uptake regulator
MYLIASSMHKDAMSAMAELNSELASEVIKSDDEVDRFSLYISRNLVLASQNGRILREMGLKKASDCLSFRSAVKSLERVADHASAMAERSAKFQEKIPREIFEKIDKMSALSLTLLGDSVEALLRRDYHLADRTVDNMQNIYLLENEVLSSTEKEKIRDGGNVKLILEDIRRTAEYASDIAEAAINETIDEIVEKYSSSRAAYS